MPVLLLSVLGRAWPYVLICALGGGLYVYHLRLTAAQLETRSEAMARQAAEATLAAVQEDKRRVDALLATREQDQAKREATLSRTIKRLKEVKTDACIDTAVPDAVTSLLTAGSADPAAAPDATGRTAGAASGARMDGRKLPGLGGLQSAPAGSNP